MSWPTDLKGPDHVIRFDCEAAMGGALQVQADLIAAGKASHLMMVTPVEVGPALDESSPAGIAHHNKRADHLNGIAQEAGLIIIGCVEHAELVHGRFMAEGPADDEPTRIVVESPGRQLHDGGAWVSEAVIKVIHENNLLSAEAAT
jgi:hypothetical protein